jgi:hypothetical protein
MGVNADIAISLTFPFFFIIIAILRKRNSFCFFLFLEANFSNSEASNQRWQQLQRQQLNDPVDIGR